MIISLGSGGHSTEMLAALSTVDMTKHKKRLYVYFSGDLISGTKARDFEDDLKARLTNEGGSAEALGKPRFIQVQRARDVGQSFVSSIWTSALCFVECVLAVRKQRPRLVLCNGPGSSLMLVLACKCVMPTCRVIYMESLARVNSLSLTGRLIRPFTNRFIVQWPELAKKCNAEYRGLLA
ncbi:UDP-N-acetylglucosamine transferase subunit ALG14 [Dipodascopsis uninucleata]